MSRQQLKRWVRAVSAGIGQGLGGPAWCQAIQAQLPALVLAPPPAGGRHQATPAVAAVSLSGVHA